MGFLYVVPILLVAGTLENRLVLIHAAICAVLREMFSPLNKEKRLVVVPSPTCP